MTSQSDNNIPWGVLIIVALRRPNFKERQRDLDIFISLHNRDFVSICNFLLNDAKIDQSILARHGNPILISCSLRQRSLNIFKPLSPLMSLNVGLEHRGRDILGAFLATLEALAPPGLSNNLNLSSLVVRIAEPQQWTNLQPDPQKVVA